MITQAIDIASSEDANLIKLRHKPAADNSTQPFKPRLHSTADTRARPIEGSIGVVGTPMKFAGKAEIYGEGEPAEYLYQVITGTVRTSKFLADGRRQIGGFYLPGEIFGLEAGEEHSYSAEAIVESRILLIKRSALVGLAARDTEVAQQLLALTWLELARAQAHVLLLVKTAQERVAGFLLEMAGRIPEGGSIELPMSRQDIADYLGLTIETVSRTLTSLENEAVISRPTSRLVVLRNRSALTRIDP